MKYLPYLLLAFGFIFVACNSSKQSAAAEEMKEKVDNTIASMAESPLSLGIKKSQCFGKCPVFEFTVDRTGMMEYKGKMHVEKLGIWKGQMPTKAREALWEYYNLRPADYLNEKYDSGAMDNPRSTLMVGRDNKTITIQKIVGDHALPKEVKEVIAYMDSLSNTMEMTIYEAQVPRDIVPGEIIIDIAPGGTIEEILTSFKEYGLKMKKRISPALRLYVVDYDETMINPGRMLVLFKEHEKVTEAQFNKAAAQRD